MRAHKAQLPPETDEWRTWLFLGGRGAGKTRAGAQWLGARAHAGQRLALVGPTLHDVREVMVEGPSGLIATADPDNRPTYEVSRRRLRYPSGAVAFAFSAEDPDSLRGPQFHHAWADEFCAWPQAGTVLAQLRLGLRLGTHPQLVITSTPKPARALRLLMAEPDLALSRAPTEENARNLSPAFLNGLQRLYGGTRLAAQELDGIVVEADGQALWRASDFPPLRCAPTDRLDRTVLAVDPTASAGGDACGLVVAGRIGDLAHVLADRTVRGLSPLGWARRAAETAEAFHVDLVVAEANQGGEMVSTLDPGYYAPMAGSWPPEIGATALAIIQPTARSAGLRIDYTAGFGATADTVPDPLKQAILALVAWSYDHRDAPDPPLSAAGPWLDAWRRVRL